MSADGSVGLGDQVRGVGEVSGADQIFGGVGADGEPVAIVAAAVFVADEIGAVGAAPFDPSGHGGEMLFEGCACRRRRGRWSRGR